MTRPTNRATITPFCVPLRQPIATGRGPIVLREGVIVALVDGDYTGWGEAAPLPGWPGGDLAEVVAALTRWAAVVNGANGDLAALGRLPIARAAIDMARADLRARQEARPLAAVLSPMAGVTVAVNALVDSASAAAVERSVADAAQAGFDTFKVKVAASIHETEVERVRQLRSLVGPAAAIRLDANGGWTAAEAAAALRAFAPFDIEFVEEPTADPADWPALRSSAGIAVAVDESLGLFPERATELLSLADVIVVKIPLIGGVEPARGLARQAIEAGRQLVVTSFHDTAIGLHAALHVAASLGPDALACGLATSSFLAADVGPVPVVRAGRMLVPTAPGLGFDPDLAALIAEPPSFA